MNLKNITFIALTVKLLFSISCVQAQVKNDTINVKKTVVAAFNKNLLLANYPLYQNPFRGNYYAKQLPFFCSKELQLQKMIGIPVKFRIGSVEYCDKIEGKDDASFH